MSLALYVAKLKGFSLRSFWGWCGEQRPIEVFSYLFEPSLPDEVQHVTSRNVVLPFYNEVPGFIAIARSPTHGNSSHCPCHADKIQADWELYSSLRRRFRAKKLVDAFVQEHFASKTVIGIHVRAGNGEGGDFVRKGRTIQNPTVWVQQVSQLLQDFLKQQSPSIPSPVLYIATDTPSMVALFRRALDPIPVLELPQHGRREEGQGVLFGVSDQVHNKDGSNRNDDYSSCLQGWTDTLMDMFLLSHADVVVAAKPSSFSQTAPMSLAFGNTHRKLSKAYCEVIPQIREEIINATTTVVHELPPKLQCFDSYEDWCCNYSTWIRFRHNGPQGGDHLHSKEFVKFLAAEQRATFAQRQYPIMRNRSLYCRRPQRGRTGGGLKDKCLPYAWYNVRISKNKF
jgi:hypothetical protein